MVHLLLPHHPHPYHDVCCHVCVHGETIVSQTSETINTGEWIPSLLHYYSTAISEMRGWHLTQCILGDMDGQEWGTFTFKFIQEADY